MAVTPASRLANLGAPNRFWIAPERKVMYVPVAKNACTALKWMVAEIAGENVDRRHIEAPELLDVHRIHDRSKWPRVRNLAQVPRETLDDIHPDRGWFVFGVVRDPRSRLFSAWQNKMLLRGLYHARLRREPWFPRFPENADWIVEDFARFVDMLVAEPDHSLLREDPHFADQSSVLSAEAVPYTRIYDVSEMKDLRADLTAHLDAQGCTPRFAPRRSNDTPLQVTGTVLAHGVREKIEDIYAEDFDQFGHRWGLARIEATPEWSDAAVEGTYVRAALGHRAAVQRETSLRKGRQASRLQGEVDQLRERVDRLERERAELDHAAPITRRLQRIERRVLARRARRASTPTG